MNDAAQRTAAAVDAITTSRVMGIETEYGIVHADEAERERSGSRSAIMLSHLVVTAYALLEENPDRRGHRVRWDYGEESPLRDARGFERVRAAAHPTQLTDQVPDSRAHMPLVPSVDAEEPVRAPDHPPADADDAEILHWASSRSLSNAVLRNGARWYVDHAHPEYCTPEVTTAADAVVWDSAGELIATRAAARLCAIPEAPGAVLFKNNTDSKGSSYGTHENFLVERAVPFENLVQALVPFLVTRQILVGAGKVGIGTRADQPGYQISSRADFFEEIVGLETTLNRPIVNTRDEPHADHARYRRLHVIIGDANRVHTGTFLKLALTSLVLAACEYEQRTGKAVLPRIDLADPVAAVHTVSHDLSLSAPLPLHDGSTMTAAQIQRAYLEAIGAIADATDPETAQALSLWETLLDALAGPAPLLDPEQEHPSAPHLEWVTKYRLLQRYRARHHCQWDDPRLAAIDLQWTQLSDSPTVFDAWTRAGHVHHRVSAKEAAAAVRTPPHDTRAYLRGALISEHPGAVLSAGWETITLATADGGTRIRFADPRQGSASWCAEHTIDPSDPIPTIVSTLPREETP